MRFLPDRSEILALASVWAIWPALAGLAWAIAPNGGQWMGFMPLPARLGIQCGQLAERGIPSLVGMALIVGTSRFVKSNSNRAFLCHLVTCVAFAFTVVTMVFVASVFSAVSGT